MGEKEPLLQMTDICKSFPGVQALSGVHFRLFPGEIHALMGQNGAGKSTLIKVLTGVYPADRGHIRLEDRIIRPHSPLEAQMMGISTVYQEVNLCPNLSVAENIYIGREPRRFGKIRWREMNERARRLLEERLHVRIDVTRPVSSYSVAIQQLVAIARALNISARVLILDEPTSSLDRSEVEQLFAVMRKLRDDGLAILFVTHFLDQVYEVSDRITVLRNGKLIGEYPTEELPRLELVAAMIGKELQALEEIPREERRPAVSEEWTLEAVGVGRKGAVEPFDLRIAKGEIVGLAGLLGSGRTEVARMLFGADRADQGRLRVSGEETVIHSPLQAINKGIAFCSENRKTEGIIDELTVRENIIAALQASQGWFRALGRKRQEELADEYIRVLNIHPPDPEIPVKNLSGGNQQKVLLARWLLTNPKLFILDEPTRGIDVGAKTEIQKLILALAREGMSVLFISSELEEVLRISHRIAVMRDRRKVSEIPGKDASRERVMQAIAGG